MDSEASKKLPKKKGQKKHKTSKKRKKHDSSGDESVDLSEKMFPIAHYIDDREEMIKQVFSVMEKEKLNCMLPPILKGMTINALKELCLRELVNMSDHEVRKVLCGEPLQTPPEKMSDSAKVDSESEVSVTSVEDCKTEGSDKRTLLDILEQEMQEIAYNTVMRKDTISAPEESEDELPEVVAVIPNNSPSRSKSNVPVICIDSGDDEPGSSTQPKEDILKDLCHSVNSDRDNLTDSAGLGNASPLMSVNKSVLENKGRTENTISEEEFLSNSQIKDSANLNQATSEKQESILIQVFPRTSASSGRVVKKVYASPKKVAEKRTSRNELDKKTDVNYEQQEDDSNCQCTEEKINHEDVLLQVRKEVHTGNNQSESSTYQPQLETVESNDVSDNSTSHAVELCTDLKITDTPESCSCAIDTAEEKEEGELSEQESEEGIEVLEPARDRYRSPTIYLSSDFSEDKSDSGRSESRIKVHRHRHRQKKSRKNSDSPERSRRRIEKRGNRSYRRKTSSSVKENVMSRHKKELSEQRSEPDQSSSTEERQELPKDCEVPLTDDFSLEVASIPMPNEVANIPIPSEIANIPIPNEVSTEKSNDLSNLESGNGEAKEDVDSALAKLKDNSGNLSMENKLDSSEETEEADVAGSVLAKTSWADRWAAKKDLKKVVITSKICRNVRKRILSARRKQSLPETAAIQPPPLPPVPPLVLHVEGSVQEYQMLQLLVSDVTDNEQNDGSKVEANNLLSIEALDSPCNQLKIDGETVGVDTSNKLDSVPIVVTTNSKESEPADFMESK